MNLEYKIYGLYILGEPIRYIGYTKHTLKRRLNGHKQKAKELNKITNDFARKNHKDNWIRKNNYNIEICLIEGNIETYEQVLEREIYWIKNYRNNGFNLLNSTDGGEGTVNRRLSDAEKENLRQKNLGKTLSEEHKQKIRESSKGRVISENTINALRNYKRTPEMLKKMSVNKKKDVLNKNGFNTYNLTDDEIIELHTTYKLEKENKKLHENNLKNEEIIRLKTIEEENINRIKEETKKELDRIKQFKIDESNRIQLEKEKIKNDNSIKKDEEKLLKKENLKLKIEQGLIREITKSDGKIIYVPVLTEEQRKERSEKYKGRKLSETTRLKLKEHLNNYRQLNGPRVLSDEEKQHLREINLGKTLSEETKNKISEKVRGENSSTAKLTEQDVLEIRRLINEFSRKQIAEKYNIDYSTVAKIISRKLWSHI